VDDWSVCMPCMAHGVLRVLPFCNAIVHASCLVLRASFALC